MTRVTDSLFAVCAPGLEPVTEAELRALGLNGVREPGGVAFDGDLHRLCRASLGLRTATRVLLRLGGFRARTFGELERRARPLSWDRALRPGAGFRLRVSCRKSRLYHEGAVAERLAAIIAERTGALPAPEAEDDGDGSQLVIVRFLRDVCTVSLDTSGAPLYMRGYRQALAKAPLRETLAAAMLLASGWPAEEPLLDPLCGSGTIAIEAALMARRIPPGLATAARVPRRFRFRDWPGHDAGVFDGIVRELHGRILERAPALVHASDRNAGAIRAAGANAGRAGVAGDLCLDVRDLNALDPPAGAGWIVTNPPYGVRVDDAAGPAGELARLARTKLAGWTLVTLSAGRGPDLAPGGVERLRTRNGGIPVRLVVRPPLPAHPG